MQILHLDIETTGLDPDKCQILEVGLLLDTLNGPLANQPTWLVKVTHDRFNIEPAALKMNMELILDIIADEDKCVYTGHVLSLMSSWLNNHRVNHDPLVLCGKNLGNFDLRFMRRLPGWTEGRIGRHTFGHRVLDVGSMYFEPGVDNKMPSLSDCLDACGFDPTVSHRALDDCRATAKCVRGAGGIPI